MEAVNHTDPVEYIKSLPPMTEESVCQTLNINMDLKTYKLYSLVQSMLYRTKNDRVDEEQECMKLVDLAYENNGEELVRNFVKRQYGDYWSLQLKIKRDKEQEVAIDELVNELATCDTLDKFIDLLKNGLKKGNKYYTIKNTSSQGYMVLRNRFLDLENPFEQRLQKLVVFLTGINPTDETTVWNGGNVLYQGKKDFKHVFDSSNDASNDGYKYYEVVNNIYKKSLYVYRNGPLNRHGHGNDKPSFWALGYETLQEMIDNITDAEWQEYKKIHWDCCGVNV